MNDSPQVILVDQQDRAIGQMEKIEAHRQGLLHRAISVVIIKQDPTTINEHNPNPYILLQQRQLDKYHCPGLWSNACCTHPLPNETCAASAHRRLQQELNIISKLNYHGHFIYRAALEGGLIEHELDHIYLGYYNQDLPAPNANEVAATRWATYTDIMQDIDANPNQYTPWLKGVLQQALSTIIIK